MNEQPSLHRKRAGIVTMFLLCFALAITARAQSQAGSISGTLMDPAGAVLRGAQVSIPAKGMIVSTDEQGRFFFSGLQPGRLCDFRQLHRLSRN